LLEEAGGPRTAIRPYPLGRSAGGTAVIVHIKGRTANSYPWCPAIGSQNTTASIGKGVEIAVYRQVARPVTRIVRPNDGYPGDEHGHDEE
jgi:hypothetical protein